VGQPSLFLSHRAKRRRRCRRFVSGSICPRARTQELDPTLPLDKDDETTKQQKGRHPFNTVASSSHSIIFIFTRSIYGPQFFNVQVFIYLFIQKLISLTLTYSKPDQSRPFPSP
jgi:hypothetical protein